jgi:hypothetical protein
VDRGPEEAAVGFVLATDEVEDRRVAWVDPFGPAALVGTLQEGDIVQKLNGLPISSGRELRSHLKAYILDIGATGKPLELVVLRGGEADVELPPFTPATVGLHPTQVYETISMLLLFLMLLAYHPLRRRDGEVMALFLVCYPLHRFLNEVLRNDTTPIAFDMTLSMNGSVLVFGVGVALWVWLLRRPIQYHPFGATQ